MKGTSGKKIWIDLDNTPHVPFFTPIIRELETRGYSVVVTARDAYQTCEVADLHRLAYARVGRHYGKNKVRKILGTCLRALQLYFVVNRHAIDLAVSHGSRSQALASKLMGIPSLCIFDYEFVGHSSLFKPTWSMAPEVIPRDALESTSRVALAYRGIKEDVYAHTFTPDLSLGCRLELPSDNVVVLVRPPATEAHYHTPLSEALFTATMDFLSRASGISVILVPRNTRQDTLVRATWPHLLSSGKVRIPEHAEDGLNLIWHSDLVISGGGTMNREAAALGVPVYSIFRGKIGAVDHYLAESGRMTLLESPADLEAKIKLVRRSRPVTPHQSSCNTLTEIVEQIVAIAETGSPAPSLR